jgi:hypothetical protein
MDIKLEAFLHELAELSKKYEIYIDGCGCCGSPFLIEGEPEYDGGGDLKWNKETKEYDCDGGI